jgi:cytochrome c556
MILTAVAVSATAVLAQSDDLSSTKLMKEQAGAMYGVLNRMQKGEIPFDQAKAEEALAKLATTSAQIPAAFPASNKGKSSPGSHFTASAKVWDNRADFEEYAHNLAKAIGDQKGKITSLDTLKAAYPKLVDNCNGCHQDYRQRKS